MSSLIVLASSLFVLDGVSGTAIAAVVALVWAVMRTPYAVAVGQLLYALLVADFGLGGALGVGLFVILFIPELLNQWHPKTAVFSIGVMILATIFLASTLVVEQLLFAGFILCLGFCVTAYTVHRYEMVRLGLVDEQL